MSELPSNLVPETPFEELNVVPAASNVVSDSSQASPLVIAAPQAIVSSVSMTLLLVLGLALIQVLFHRATPESDNIVKSLEYCSMIAGYSLLALPMWGIFETLRRTRLYITGPKYVIAFGYISLMGALLYFAYKIVILSLNILI